MNQVRNWNNVKTVMACAAVGFAVLAVRGGALAQTPKSNSLSLPSAKSLSKEDEQAVRKTIIGVEEAWNAHDMKAFGKLLREDAEWINIVGMHWRGRAAVEGAHAAFHATMFKNHRIKTDDIHIRSLSNNIVIAVVTTTNDAFTTPGGQVMSKAQNRQSYVLTKEPTGWMIVHCENVRVDADAVQHNPIAVPAK